MTPNSSQNFANNSNTLMNNNNLTNSMLTGNNPGGASANLNTVRPGNNPGKRFNRSKLIINYKYK